MAHIDWNAFRRFVEERQPAEGADPIEREMLFEAFEQAAAEQAEQELDAALLPPGGPEHVRYWRSAADRMQHYCEGNIAGFSFGASSKHDPVARMTLTDDNIVGLTLNASLQDKLIEALSQCKVYHIIFSLSGMAQKMEHLRAAGITDMDQVAACGAAVGRRFGSPLFIEFRGEGIFANMAFINAVINACRHMDYVGFNFTADEEDVDQLPALEACIANNANIKNLDMVGIEIHTFRALWSSMPTMPQLSMVSMDGQRFNLSSVEDANTIAGVLAMPHLETLVLVNIKLANVEVARIVINALAASRLQKLTIYNWVLPQETHVTLANALLQSNLVELEYQTSAHPDFLEAFSNGLGNPATAIRVLSLGSFYLADCCYFYKSKTLSDFLRNACKWRLEEVTLFVADWGESFDEALSRYVEKSTTLRKLTISIAPGYTGPAIASEALLKALDQGVRHLAEVILMHEDEHVSADWCARVQHVLELNRKRIIHGPKFERIATAELESDRRRGMLEAVEAVDLLMLYEFIRRNEWDLQDLIRENCREY
ncbi:hypothetical protein MPSEU_000829900 [Mayamaea pseudoterrestris]|nr:hypothetical protein MPSEU_000829900 [Mayamaea pseudoterrestris]